jgi:hypothetical protein
MNKEELILSVTDQEQRGFIKIARIMGWTAGAIHHELNKHLKNKAMPKKSVERWVTDLNKGRTDVEDKRGGAHHLTEDKDQRIERIERMSS